MKKFVAVLAGVALFVAPANAALRMFFSTIGANQGQSLLEANPGLTLPIARSNPSVASGSRLYLWAEMITSTPGATQSQKWNGVSFDVVVNGGRVTANSLYNYVRTDPDTGDFLYERWQGVNSGVIQANGSVLNANLAAVVRGEGINNGANAAAASNRDLQSEVGVLAEQGQTAGNSRSLIAPAGFSGKAVLLGFYDVALDAGSTSASVFLKVGTGGIVRQGQTAPEPIYFGSGDEGAGILGGSFGTASPNADATITPEPASLALLGLAALALRRR